MAGDDPSPHAFSLAERARLAAYKAAIEAGFFTNRDTAADVPGPKRRQAPQGYPPAGDDPAFAL